MREICILVIDDSSAIRDFITDALAKWEGVVILEAKDGAQGLEMAMRESPDLILLDVEMPRLTGFEVVDALQARQVSIPIIMITSHGSEAIAVELFRKGVKDYMSKPFTADQLYDAVERALSEARLVREKETLTQHLSTVNHQLRLRVHEMDVLYKAGNLITSGLSKEDVLEEILDSVFSVTGAEEAALMLVNEESDQLEPALYRQREPGEMPLSARHNMEEMAANAARTGELTITGTTLSAPLRSGDQVIGVLGANNRGHDQPFSMHERRLLLALADYAAITVSNSPLLNATQNGIQEATQTDPDIVSTIAHELETPITSVRGYADMLLKGMVEPLAPKQEQVIRAMRGSAVRMQLLISDLQDISQIEAGHLPLELEAISLIETLKETLQATKRQIEARSQELIVQLPDSLPLVQADKTRLTQILINLVSNAYKYTPKGGKIQVRAWHQQGMVYCAVSDTGIGLSPEDQARLFRKFFRSENPTVQKMSGTGLGLCIVKHLVELQGGQVMVQSKPGQGSTFAFTVPVAAETS
jgi:signal transduction histidine kinase/DNA-binding response OmpR family regulator